MKRRELTYLLLCLLLLCTAVACTTVELCPETDHPHLATIRAEFDWSGNDADKPARMNIVASRILNTWRTHGIADTKTGHVAPGLSAIREKPSQETEETPDTEGQEQPQTREGESTEGNEETNGTEGEETPDTPAEDPEKPEQESLKLKGGEYNLFAINTYTGLSIDSLQCYLDHPQAMVDTLYLHMQETSRNDLPELKGIDMPDFNPKYKYIQNAGRIFYAATRGVTIRTGQTETLRFTATPVSQSVTIKFKVRTIGEVQVDSLIAEISGVCGRMNIADAYLDTANLYRIIFRPEVEKKAEDVITYKAVLHVLGIIPSPKESYLIGPGIIQVAVYASSGKRRRIYYAGANPRQNIIDAKMTEKREDGRTYLAHTDPVTIELDGELKIDADQILNQKEDNFDIWFDSDTKIDVDV